MREKLTGLHFLLDICVQSKKVEYFLFGIYPKTPQKIKFYLKKKKEPKKKGGEDERNSWC